MHDVHVREAEAADLPAARRLVASAFMGEPFTTAMYGPSPRDRFAGLLAQYAGWPFAPDGIAVVAVLADTVVGAARAVPPGRCRVCTEVPDDLPPDATTARRIDHEFDRLCREAHLGTGLPTHGHVASVAVDPVVHGAGIGRALVQALLDRLDDAGAECVVLECLETRRRFYEQFGFRAVTGFPDPGAPTLQCFIMRRDRD